MVAYEYRCETHGLFAVHRPMGTAASAIACETCKENAVRIYSAPMLRQGPANRVALKR